MPTSGKSSSGKGGRGKSKPANPPHHPRPPPTPPPQRGSAGQTFRDMAAIAGGVALGSAVGTAAGNAITGATSSGAGSAEACYTPGPCDYELYDFVQCADAHTEDLSACEPANKKLQDCKKRNSMK